MGKNIKMLQVYKEVLKGNKYEIEKVIPNMYARNFYDIDFDRLREINIDKIGLSARASKSATRRAFRSV